MRPLELVTVCGISVSLNFGESARIMKLGVRAAHLMRLGLRRLASTKRKSSVHSGVVRKRGQAAFARAPVERTRAALSRGLTILQACQNLR